MIKMEPIVSVIIPCFNQALYLKETVGTVLNSNFRQFEIIIVDDGSTDHSLEVANQVASDYPDIITTISQKNSGPSAARNAGIKHSRGKFILPLDGDDLINENYIGDSVNVLLERQDVKIVYCRAVKFGARNGPWNLKTYSLKGLAMDNLIFVSGIFRKSDWEFVGGYDERMIWGWEDWEFWINILKSGGEVVQLPYAGFYYRIRPNSRRKSTNRGAKQKTIKLINEKHKDFIFSQLYGPVRNPRSWSIWINKLQRFFKTFF